MSSSDGPLESAMIRCPSGHCFNAPIEFLTVKSGEKQAPAIALSAGRDSRHGSRDGHQRPVIITQLAAEAALLPSGAGIQEWGCYQRLDGRGDSSFTSWPMVTEQESGAAGGYEHQPAGSFRGIQMPPKPGSGNTRPNGAPAYYLGRPASLWISVMRPRRSATHTTPGGRHPTPAAPSPAEGAKPRA
jgi:hypothetical protein